MQGGIRKFKLERSASVWGTVLWSVSPPSSSGLEVRLYKQINGGRLDHVALMSCGAMWKRTLERDWPLLICNVRHIGLLSDC